MVSRRPSRFKTALTATFSGARAGVFRIRADNPAVSGQTPCPVLCGKRLNKPPWIPDQVRGTVLLSEVKDLRAGLTLSGA